MENVNLGCCGDFYWSYEVVVVSMVSFGEWNGMKVGGEMAVENWRAVLNGKLACKCTGDACSANAQEALTAHLLSFY